MGAWSNPFRPTHSVASPLTNHQDSHSRPFFSHPSSPVQRCSEIPAMIAASNAPTPRESRPGFFTDLAANHGFTFCEARRAASSTAVKQAFTPSLLSRSFKASNSCEGHSHPSCCKPTNVIIESHGFHATRFLPATKVAEGRNWGAGDEGVANAFPRPPLPG